MKDDNVGLIGTGMIGEPMARNLIKAGFNVLVFNRTKSKASALCAEGAHWADSPAEIARSSTVIITIVSDSPDEAVPSIVEG